MIFNGVHVDKVWTKLVEHNKEEQFEYAARIWREGYSDLFDTYPVLEQIKVPGWNIVGIDPEMVSTTRFFEALADGSFLINPDLRSPEMLHTQNSDYYAAVVGSIPLLWNREYSMLLKSLGIAYGLVPKEKRKLIWRMYCHLIEYSLLEERKPEPELGDRILDTGLTMALGSKIIPHPSQLNKAMSTPDTIRMQPDTILSEPRTDTYMVIPSLREAIQLVWAVTQANMN